MASLLLEPRPWVENTGKGKATGPSSLKFRILLSNGHSNEDLNVAWRWQELEVEPVEDPDSPMTRVNSDAQTLNIASLSIISS